MAGLEAQSHFAPWGLWPLAQANILLAFTAAMRVIHRVHGTTPHRWTPTQPAAAAGATVFNVLMGFVTDTANAGEALLMHQANLAARQLNLAKDPFFGDQLCLGTCAPGQLAASALHQFKIVNLGADRNLLQGQPIAAANLSLAAAREFVTDFHAA